MDWLKVALIVIIIGQLCTAVIIAHRSEKILSPLSRYNRHEEFLASYTAVVIGILAWTCVWILVVGFEAIRSCPYILLGCVWVIALGLFQLFDLFHGNCEDTSDSSQRRSRMIRGLHSDTSTIVSMTFATGTLLWAMANVGNKANLFPAAKLVMVSLILSLAFIVPTQRMAGHSQRYVLYVRGAQTVALNYATGFILTALLLIFSNCSS